MVKQQTPSPGWYPDPGGGLGYMFFDGRNWTGHCITAGRIDGSILSVTGIYGIATGFCNIIFERDSVVVMLGEPSNFRRLAYSDITSLQVDGRGALVTTSGGGWMGGGFGASGVLEGFALASVLNALTTQRRFHIETIIHLDWQAGSLTMLNTELLLPDQWAWLLSPVIKGLEKARLQAALEMLAQNNQTLDRKVCPFCAETVKAAAVKCRYCGSEL